MNLGHAGGPILGGAAIIGVFYFLGTSRKSFEHIHEDVAKRRWPPPPTPETGWLAWRIVCFGGVAMGVLVLTIGVVTLLAA